MVNIITLTLRFPDMVEMLWAIDDPISLDEWIYSIGPDETLIIERTILE